MLVLGLATVLLSCDANAIDIQIRLRSAIERVDRDHRILLSRLLRELGQRDVPRCDIFNAIALAQPQLSILPVPHHHLIAQVVVSGPVGGVEHIVDKHCRLDVHLRAVNFILCSSEAPTRLFVFIVQDLIWHGIKIFEAARRTAAAAADGLVQAQRSHNAAVDEACETGDDEKADADAEDPPGSLVAIGKWLLPERILVSTYFISQAEGAIERLELLADACNID